VLQQPHELLYCDPGGADKTSEQTAVKLLMVRNREMPAVRTVVNHMASTLVIENNLGCQIDLNKGLLGRERQSVCVADSQDTGDCLLDVGNRFSFRFPLGETAGQGRALCQDIPIFSREETNQEFARHGRFLLLTLSL